MKDKNANAPEIRFEGFTDDWIQCKLGDVCGNFKSGNGITSDSIFDVGVYPVYGGNGMRGYTNTFTHNGDFVLIGRQGALCGNINSVLGKVYISEHAIVISENESSNIAYLEQLLSKLQLNRYSESSAQPGLSVDKLKKIDVVIPKKEEQTAIGTFFRTFDNAIHNHQQKLNCLRELKKGYLQQMFPQDGETVPKVRFAGFTGDWQNVHLGDVVEKLKSYSLSRDVETSDVTGYRYIHYGDIHKQVADIIIDDGQLPCIKIGDYIALKQGDLVLADASEDYIGIAEPCVILHEPQEQIIAGLHTIAIRPISTDSLFLYHLFHTDGFRKFGGFVGTGLKVFGITFPNLSKYEMKLPSFAEQAAIGGFFLNLDMQISSTITKLEKLKQLKAAYLQKMFV